MPIGEINLRAFDLGVVTLLGGQSVTVTVDGDPRPLYVMPVPGLKDRIPWLASVETGNPVVPLIPIQFKAAEDRHQEAVVPSVTVIRTSETPNFSRRAWFNITNREPAIGATPVNVQVGNEIVSGHSAYAERWQDTPYDIAYEIELRSRRMSDYLLLERLIRRKCVPPAFVFQVTDLLNTLREYDAVDISYNDTSALSAPQKRELSLSVSFTVWGELTDSDPVIKQALTSPPTFTTTRKD